MAKYRAKRRDFDDEGHFLAAKISVVSCEHGTVWVRLHDRDGEIGAFASMPKETALDLAKSILAELDDIVAGRADACDTVH